MLFYSTRPNKRVNWLSIKQKYKQWRKSWWGGGPPPPHLHGKLTNFRKFWPKRGLKTVFSSANGGTSEIWKFCRKFRRLCPPTGKSEFPPLNINTLFIHIIVLFVETKLQLFTVILRTRENIFQYGPPSW